MILDLLSSNNNVTFNSNIAQIIGLEGAVYFSEILNQYRKAAQKSNNYNKDNFVVKINRTEITKRTTLATNIQQKLDGELKQLSLIDIENDKNKNTLIFNENSILKFLSCPTNVLFDYNKELQKLKKKTIELDTKLKDISKPKRLSKVEQEKINFKQNLDVENEELKNAYCSWIDSVYRKLGWMSQRAITVAQKRIDEESNCNLDVALKILDIATVNGYKDIEWAIKIYKDRSVNKSTLIIPKNNVSTFDLTPAELGDEVF